MMKTFTLLVSILFSLALVAQNEIIVKDADIEAGDQVTWTSENTYLLDGYVFVEEGAVLTIEAGTVVKGLTQSEKTVDDPASALIISRGGKIMAEGTATSPIIFTSSNDDVTTTDDLILSDRGQWGGVVILGNGIGGFKEGAETFNIEGIPSEGYGDKALYGGSDNADDSGVLKYVSIRHAGFQIAPDNELNGLTLGAVGSGTTIDYVEVFANADDGIEWFGGAVSVKHAVVGFVGDESFDYDQSWAGKGQFWFGLSTDGDRGFEIDGSEAPDRLPMETPVISNLTLIGDNDAARGKDAFRFKVAGTGQFHNAVIMDYGGEAISIEDEETYAGFSAGNISFSNSYWYNFGKGTDLASIVNVDGGDKEAVLTMLSDNNNVLGDPGLKSISRTEDNGLNPLPLWDSPLRGAGVAVEGDDWFDQTSYIGAFGDDNWAAGWTALSEYGIMDPNAVAVSYKSNTEGLSISVVNPVINGTATLTIELPEVQNIRVNVFDMVGKNIKSFEERKMSKGISTRTIDLSSVATGTYFITLETEQGIVSNKFLISK